MIDEKKLIEAIKERIKRHESDADLLKDEPITFDMEEMLLRIADEGNAMIELVESQPEFLALCQWERDVAMEQLKSYGVGLGEKAELKKVVHGKWLDAEEQPYFRKHYHAKACSECNYRKGGKWKFCPNCGAAMDKED